MKKGLLCLGIVFLLLLAMTLAAGWLLTTPEGVRWLMETVSGMGKVEIHAEKIEGKFFDELLLEGVTIRWPESLIEIDRVRIRWNPADLLTGKIALSNLDVERMSIKDGRPETSTPTELTLPKVQLLPVWLHLEAKSFRLKELTYRRSDREPFIAGGGSARIVLSQSAVDLKEIAFHTPYGSGGGGLEIQFLKPSLKLDLNLIPREAVLGLNRLSIRLNLLPSRHPEQMAGTITLSGERIPGKKVQVKGDVAVAPNRISIRQGLLLYPGYLENLAFNGQVSFISDEPLIRLQLNLKEFDLSNELMVKARLSGDLLVEGNPSDFRGRFTMESSGESWRAARLSGSFRGNRQEVHILALDGALLDGILKGQLQASWSKGFSLSGTLQGRDLDPNRITRDWPGRINLNIDGHIRWVASAPIEGKLEAFLLDSRFRGKTLTGRIDARVDQGMIRLEKADLHGNGFDLDARGDFRDRLDFKARVSDLSSLIPGTNGRFNGNGWVRWRENLWSGFLTGQGKDISTRDFKAARMEVTARLDEEARGKVALKTRADQVVAGPLQADSVSVDIKGTPEDHAVEIDVRWPEGDTRGSLTGGFSKETWKGTIHRLSGNYPQGRAWNMTSPAALSLSTARLSLTPLVLTSGTGERMEIRADLSLNPMTGILEAGWERCDLTRLHRWMTKPLLLGRTTGKMKAEWPGEERIRLHAGVDMEGTVQASSFKSGQVRGSVNLEWNERGLDASYKVEGADGGSFRGEISSPESGRFGFPEQVKIKVFWGNIDLNLFKDWFPRDLTLKGRTEGRLSGQRSKGKPWISTGEMNVLQGTLAWKTGEGLIQSALGKADLNWSWRGDDLQGHLALNLTDYGEITGEFRLPLTGHWPPAFQSAGPLSLSLKAQLQEKGLLSTLFPERVKESRGSLDLNLNASGTWEKPRVEGSLRLKNVGIRLPVTTSSFPNEKSPQDLQLDVPHGSANLRWNGKGLLVSCEMELAEGGRLRGQLISQQPARLAFPAEGNFNVALKNIRLSAARPWIPSSLDLTGLASGQIEGEWFARSQFKMKGGLSVFSGNLNWKREEGQVSVKVKETDLRLHWDDQTLRGDLALTLEEYGHAKGNFRLSLPARLPLAHPRDGPIHFLLEGQFKEMGLLTTLFPGIIRESHGQVDLNLTVNGTWKKPKPEGHLILGKAGATFPSAGIRLEDIALDAGFSGDRIRITSFRARSGPGHIEGTATFFLDDWRISRLQGVLGGDRFQMIYLPDLQVYCTPRLELDGTPEKLKVRGEIRLPEFSVLGLQATGMIRPSPDVILVDRKETQKLSPVFPLDAEIRVLLGEKVFVRTGGIDARLSGSLTLSVEAAKAVRADGEIQVAQGRYTFYGQKLDITRGRLRFNGPIDNPSLDVLALRRVKGSSRWEEQLQEVQAGVAVTGTIQSPMVRLYSQPALPEKDILSYIVFGQPLNRGNPSQTASLMQAAGALLSAGEAVLLKNQLSGQLGIDSLDIRATTVGAPGGTDRTGSAESSDLSRSIVTVGKYLDPKLYIGVGGSPFTKAYQLILRYSLTKHVEIETKAGTASGANLYYKIEFD